MPLCTDCIITISDPPLCRATVEQKYGSVVWILLNNICGKKPGCPGGFMPCSYFSCAAIWQVEDPGILWWVVYEQGSESPFIFWVIRGELFCWGWGLGGGGEQRRIFQAPCHESLVLCFCNAMKQGLWKFYCAVCGHRRGLSFSRWSELCLWINQDSLGCHLWIHVLHHYGATECWIWDFYSAFHE